MGNIQELSCPRCKTPVAVEEPKMCIANSETTSMVIFSHEILPVCPSCGLGLQFMLQAVAGIQIKSAYAPVEVKTSPLVIVPPGSGKLIV